MINLRELFFDNPELRRNLRIELRSKRLFTVGIITALFALVVLPSLTSVGGAGSVPGGMSPYLMALMWSQKITLAMGGAIFCWRSVKRERELNTYDFQRITRLSPLELAVGKLLGAPALSYFVTLCLVPPGIISAMNSGSAFLGMLIQSYIILLTSSLVVHAFALMISTISDKGGALGGIVVLVLLQAFPLLLGLLSVTNGMTSYGTAGGMAVIHFYGLPIPSTLLWAVVELGFVAWLLLAVVRNIKIDLEAMQLFTVKQGLGFAGYCNFVWIGFFPWGSASHVSSSAALLLLGVAFFYLVGIGVLPGRELVRSELRESRGSLLESGTWLGPIRMFVTGAAVTEILILMFAEQSGAGDAIRRFGLDLFLVSYFAAWLARDLFYLQWMKVRPVRSPLRKAFLYLGVFYLTIAIVFRGGLASVDTAAFTGCFAPFPALFPLMNVNGESAMAMWLVALLSQIGAAAAFAYLYRQEIAGLRARPKPVPPAGTASAPPAIS